jgi:hypothetical protein
VAVVAEEAVAAVVQAAVMASAAIAKVHTKLMQQAWAVPLVKMVLTVNKGHTQVVHTMAQAWVVEQVAVVLVQNHGMMGLQVMARQAAVAVY